MGLGFLVLQGVLMRGVQNSRGWGAETCECFLAEVVGVDLVNIQKSLAT